MDGFVEASTPEIAIDQLADQGIIGVYSLRSQPQETEGVSVQESSETPVNELSHKKSVAPIASPHQGEVEILKALGGLADKIREEEQPAGPLATGDQGGQRSRSGEPEQSPPVVQDSGDKQNQSFKGTSDNESGEPDVFRLWRRDFFKRFLHFAEAFDWLLWEGAIYVLWYCVVFGLKHVSSWAGQDADESSLVFLRKYAPWGLVIVILIHTLYDIMNCLIGRLKALKDSWTRK